MSELKTSVVWIKEPQFDGYKIMDPDGWDRTNLEYSFYEEQITQSEFVNRLMNSTVQIKMTK